MMPSVQRKATLLDVPPEGKIPGPPVSLSGVYREIIERGLGHQGTIHPGRAWRLSVLGDAEIFRGRPVLSSSRIRASATLLWDWSSSQSLYAPQLLESLDAIGCALRDIGILVWAGAYTTTTLTEYEGATIARVADYRDRWDSRRVWALRHWMMGGTPTAPALAYLRCHVLPTAPSGRRLVVVCTDALGNEPEDWEARALAELPETILCAIYCGEKNDLSRHRDIYGAVFRASTREEIPRAFGQVLELMRS